VEGIEMRMSIIRWIIAYLWKKYRFLFVDVLNDDKLHVHRNPTKKEVQEAFNTLKEADEETLEQLNQCQVKGE
jgi:hypothetical protein